ncbi:MAG TPA: helix-turn-helix domain-containing protein [archaeon]|nr:helix-turn-helix domain-containing protein [archaeon]
MIHKLPQEISTWYIIPAIRREFVKEMINQGLSQKKAADRLGLTEAAVSNYMKDKRASQVKLNDHIKEMIKGSVVNILSKQSDVFTEVYNVVKECEKDLTVCQIHAAYDEIPEGCKICFSEKEELIKIKEEKKEEA